MTAVDDLDRAVSRLVEAVTHWTPARWAASTASGATRADVAHALAQRLADLEAQATGRVPRPVPRLPSEYALPDQWRVLARDLIGAQPGPEVVAAAVQAVAQARSSLLPPS